MGVMAGEHQRSKESNYESHYSKYYKINKFLILTKSEYWQQIIYASNWTKSNVFLEENSFKQKWAFTIENAHGTVLQKINSDPVKS